jgi:hypothetical protein
MTKKREEIKGRVVIFCTALHIFDHSTSEAICLFCCSKCPPHCTAAVRGIKPMLRGNQIGYISLETLRISFNVTWCCRRHLALTQGCTGSRRQIFM